jgi:class 3 adenylate cyclase/predicted ATPase
MSDYIASTEHNRPLFMSSECTPCETLVQRDSKFCIKCGAPLPSACPLFYIDNPPKAKFCSQCGASLLQHGKNDAELRHMTVLLCDLVGSTELSERKDPEELRELIVAYQECCSRILERFGGYIAQFLGDGVLAYFGYPMAYEHDACRAVEASLCIVEEVGAIAVQGEKLKARIGIHTGTVVIGAQRVAGYQESQAIGETPNLAARLQSEADPNTVVISDTTARLVRGFFEFEQLDRRRLKGFSYQTAVYRVRRLTSSYLDAVITSGLTPLVGRAQEIELARMCWRRARAGSSQTIQIVGEPGIGKSRLISVLRENASKNGDIILECRCSPYHQNSALHPFVELLQRELGFTRADSKDAKHKKLKNWLELLSIEISDALPVLRVLLNLSDKRDLLRNMTPQKEREVTLETLSALLAARAAQCPTLFILEDLQWADPSTLELTEQLVEPQETSPILSVLSYRPEFETRWTAYPNAIRLELSRLSRKQSETMISQMLGKNLPREVVEHVLERAEGVPLFIEEVTKAVVESSALREVDDSYVIGGPLPRGLIPATVLDSLTARLDRLGDAVPVAQVAAALGREFSYELLRSVSFQSQTELRQALDKLIEAQLVFCTASSPEPVYMFKHALIRDAVYKSLLKSKRQQVHEQIAQVLEKQFPETAATQPELLAYHYQEAGLNGQAILYWQRAGQRAIEHSANNEAIAHFTRGLELLETLPDNTERIQKELILQSALGTPLVMTRGYGAPEVEKAYGRAWELCQQVGETRQLFTALRGLWVFYLVRADYRTAHELGGQLLNIAKAEQAPALFMEAHMTLAIPLFYLSDTTRCRAHLDEAIAIYDPERHRSHAFLYGQDPGMACRGFQAWMLGLLGYQDQAKKTIDQTVELAHKQAHPFSLACALHFASLVYQLCREPGETELRAEAEMSVSKEQGFPLFVGGGTALRGWALLEEGQKEAGISQMQQGIAAWHSTGADLARSYWLVLLAEAYGTIGQAANGLATLAEAFSAISKNEEHFYEAELYRVKGDLLLQAGALEPEAEACFHQAIDIARRQSTKTLELRAVMSLSVLWKTKGRVEQARELLGEVYDWFSEGFDSVDLTHAKALLHELI